MSDHIVCPALRRPPEEDRKAVYCIRLKGARLVDHRGNVIFRVEEDLTMLIPSSEEYGSHMGFRIAPDPGPASPGE